MLTVELFSGARNRAVVAGGVREVDRDLLRALELIRDLQEAAGLGLREENADNQTRQAKAGKRLRRRQLQGCWFWTDGRN